MTRDVRLLFFTQALDCETCPQTRQILDEFPPLSNRITIEEVNLILDTQKASEYGIDRAPAIAVTYRDSSSNPANPLNPLNPLNDLNPEGWIDSRIRFLGAPAGYEFISLVQAVLIAGGQPLRLSDESRTLIAAVNKPIAMRVFTTPT